MEEVRYRIPIAGEWSLEDLYVYPRTYEQCYFTYLALLSLEDDADQERIDHAFDAFPWQGGYSAVNFYNQLKWSVPRQLRPRVRRIQYASPGFIELSLAVAAALAIARIVHAFCSSARDVNATYTEIYRDLQERKLLKVETEAAIQKLTRDDEQVIQTHLSTLGAVLEVDLITLNDKTGSPFKSLKVLLSLFRRMRTLAQYQKSGKTKL